MGKRLETLRRSESRDSLDSMSSRDSVQTMACDGGGKKQQPLWPLGQPSSNGDQSKSSALKGFFTRIGSTGMLSYSRLYSNSFRDKLRRSRKLQTDRQQLYRSVSTSHLAGSSYMKGDDPADCLDHRGDHRDVLQPDDHHSQTMIIIESPTEAGYVPLKTRSCDNISKLGTSKKPNFPHAFLRSRLSVLPEENGGNFSCRPSDKQKSTSMSAVQPREKRHHHSHDHRPHHEHEIVVTEELFKEMDSDRECRRVFSNLSSSNESGYDSDGPRTLDCGSSGTSSYQNRKACTDEDSGFGDTKSLAADSLNEFVTEEQHHSEPTPRRHHHSDKDYNVPSMCLFYKRNRELNDRMKLQTSSEDQSKNTAFANATTNTAAAPNFHRRMFVKNRCPSLGTTADPALSSLPADLNNVRSHMQIVRLLKTQHEEDIGVCLRMVVKQVANYNETRFYVMKLEPGKIAYK